MELQDTNPSVGIPWAWPIERERIEVGPFIEFFKGKKIGLHQVERAVGKQALTLSHRWGDHGHALLEGQVRNRPVLQTSKASTLGPEAPALVVDPAINSLACSKASRSVCSEDPLQP